MFKIASALRSLGNRWIIAILLIIQFTLGLSGITGSVNLFSNIFYLNDESNNMLDLKRTYVITYDMTAERITSKMSDRDEVEGIYKKLSENEYVTGIGTYSQAVIWLDNYNGPLKEELFQDMEQSLFKQDSITVSGIEVDEGYYKLLNQPVAEGRGFTVSDFTRKRGENRNVLLGSYFKKYFKIGDEIVDANGKYTVIGFLPEGKYIVQSNDTNTFYKADTSFIVPMPIDIHQNYDAMFSNLLDGTVLYLNEDADIEELNNLIQLSKSDITLYIESLYESINSNITNTAYSEVPASIAAIAFIVFSIIGIVVTTMVSIMMRRREFGIRMALGESMQSIFSQIVLENVVIVVSGFVLSIIYFSLKYRGLLEFSRTVKTASTLDIKLNFPILFIVFLFLCLIMAISNFITYRYLMRFEPKDLIGGFE